MFILLLDSFTIALIMLIWFNTQAVVEYLRLMRFPLIMSYLEDYVNQKASKKIEFANFIEYLNFRWPTNFFVKLISCPICLGTWLGIVMGIYEGFFLDGLAIAFLGIFFYYLSTLIIERH